MPPFDEVVSFRLSRFDKEGLLRCPLTLTPPSADGLVPNEGAGSSVKPEARPFLSSFCISFSHDVSSFGGREGGRGDTRAPRSPDCRWLLLLVRLMLLYCERAGERCKTGLPWLPMPSSFISLSRRARVIWSSSSSSVGSLLLEDDAVLSIIGLRPGGGFCMVVGEGGTAIVGVLLVASLL